MAQEGARAQSSAKKKSENSENKIPAPAPPAVGLLPPTAWNWPRDACCSGPAGGPCADFWGPGAGCGGESGGAKFGGRSAGPDPPTPPVSASQREQMYCSAPTACEGVCVCATALQLGGCYEDSPIGFAKDSFRMNNLFFQNLNEVDGKTSMRWPDYHLA